MDLRATREGDDLRIAIRGTQNGLTFEGYFAGGQDVTILEAGGANVTANDLYAASESEQVTRDTLKEDQRIAARSVFFADAVGNGLHPVDGSTAELDEYQPFHASFADTHGGANNESLSRAFSQGGSGDDVMTGGAGTTRFFFQAGEPGDSLARKSATLLRTAR